MSKAKRLVVLPLPVEYVSRGHAERTLAASQAACRAAIERARDRILAKMDQLEHADSADRHAILQAESEAAVRELEQALGLFRERLNAVEQ